MMLLSCIPTCLFSPSSSMCIFCGSYLDLSYHDPRICFTHRLLAGDSIRNIISSHHMNFLRRIELHPNIHLVFAREFGLKILSESKQPIVDGTFDLCEGKLILTTIMGLKDDIAMPAAYLLSNSKEEHNYKSYFELIQAKTNHRMAPDGVLMDFEVALSSAWSRVFSLCGIWRDLFHFQQANLKRLLKLGLKDYRTKVAENLRTLYKSLDSKEFHSNLQLLLRKWKETIPQYADYFDRTWVKLHPPQTWVSFGRPEWARSGSGAIEGHHNRLQNSIITSVNPKNIDQLAKILWEEETYYSHTATSKLLWEEKQKTHRNDAAKYAKRRKIGLKDYVSLDVQPRTSALPAAAESIPSSTSPILTLSPSLGRVSSYPPTTTSTDYTSDASVSNDALDGHDDRALGTLLTQHELKERAIPISRLSVPQHHLYNTRPEISNHLQPIDVMDILSDGEDDNTAGQLHFECQTAPTSTFGAHQKRDSSFIKYESAELSCNGINAAASTIQHTSRPPIPTNEQCVCKKYRINKSCSLKMCKSCCCANAGHCVITDHARGKISMLLPPSETTKKTILVPGLLSELNSLMETKRNAFIAYGGGSNPGTTARKITPLRWDKPNIMLRALCHNENPPMEKNFSVFKITRLENKSWTNNPSQQQNAAVEPFEVEGWLKGFNMQQYLSMFLENGFADRETIETLDKDMLIARITTLGHQAIIMHKKKVLKGGL